MHYNSKDLTNKTFNDLTALYVVDKHCPFDKSEKGNTSLRTSE